ncbi:MAG TPA: class II aldolase/adducin family protein [Chloroflexota bacterium]|nr:class II aldolase/adducin family protein [Chloroflexota bacterium]
MKDQELREKLVQACRILAHEGHEHFYLGHVSVRASSDGELWAKPTGLGLEEVLAEDMVLADMDGQRLEGERKLHTEMPIHTGIYKRRPDVHAVVHTHAFHAAALSASTARFEYVSQDSLVFAGGVAAYPSAELVESAEQGERLAQALGQADVALMRNHGLTAVGASIEQAVVRAVSFERSCRLQLAAAQFGGVSPVPPDEAERMIARFGRQSNRETSIWRYLLRSACA